MDWQALFTPFKEVDGQCYERRLPAYPAEVTILMITHKLPGSLGVVLTAWRSEMLLLLPALAGRG